MKTVFLFLITGFEEIEALATVDILRRAGIEVKTVSLTSEQIVTGSHGIPVTADIMFANYKEQDARMLVIPGGTPAYNDHQEFKQAILAFANKGKQVAAICAAPMVLGGLGLLKGKKATCYPSFEKYLDGAILATDEAVVVQENITTGKGPGLTFHFALSLVEQLEGKPKRDEVAKGLLLN